MKKHQIMSDFDTSIFGSDLFADKFVRNPEKADCDVSMDDIPKDAAVVMKCYGCNGRGWVKILNIDVKLCPICRGNARILRSLDGMTHSLPEIDFMEKRNGPD